MLTYLDRLLWELFYIGLLVRNHMKRFLLFLFLISTYAYSAGTMNIGGVSVIGSNNNISLSSGSTTFTITGSNSILSVNGVPVGSSIGTSPDYSLYWV